MGNVVVPKIKFQYIPTAHCVVYDDESYVDFQDFDVGKAILLPEHRNFIENFVARHIIKLIEAVADPTLTQATVYTFGAASATSTAKRNQGLSEARAAAVGSYFKEVFDKQKAGTRFAVKVSVVINGKGLGDARARVLRDQAEKRFKMHATDQQVELMQGKFRSGGITLNLQALLTEDHYVYQCRELYQADLKKESVPGNLLEQKIAEFEKTAGTAGMWVLKQIWGKVKSKVWDSIKTLFEEIPLLGLIGFAWDFIYPTDVAMLFEFKDHREVHAIYLFGGSSHATPAIGPLGTITAILGARKSLVKLEEALKKVEADPKYAKYKTKVSFALEQVRQVKAEIDGALDDLNKPGSVLRKVLGDANTEIALAIIREEDPPATVRVPISDWSSFSFEKKSFYDVRSFSGPAVVTSKDVALGSDVTLEFAGRDPHGYLGYAARVDLHVKTSLRNSLLGAGLANEGMMQLTT
jgi:hypothetical protein